MKHHPPTHVYENKHRNTTAFLYLFPPWQLNFIRRKTPPLQPQRLHRDRAKKSGGFVPKDMSGKLPSIPEQKEQGVLSVQKQPDVLS